jgi:hypothetical protein
MMCVYDVCVYDVCMMCDTTSQIKLVRWDNRHKDITAKLQTWVAEKEAYLNTKEVINSVGAAQYELSRLDGYDQESKQVESSTFASLVQMGNDLAGETFESIDATRAREQELAEAFVRLGGLSTKKRPVLEDDLAREQFRDGLRLQNQEHIDIHTNLTAWIGDKEAYLNTKEAIDSVSEAQVQLSLLDSYEAEKQMATDSNVAQLKALGGEIQGARYSTQYSSAQWETPGEIDERHANVDAKWAELSQLSSHKRVVLEDDLARENFKANLRVLNTNHNDKSVKLQAWIAEKEAYLNTKEEINSVAEAQLQLSLLDAYDKDKESTTATNVAQLKALGAEIHTAKYSTEHSSACWSSMNEQPEQVQEREAAVDAKWVDLSQLSAAKRLVLEDDLAREIFKANLRVLNTNHNDKTAKLQAWIAEKEVYLNTKEKVESVAEAQLQLSLLDAYERDKSTLADTNVAALKALGAEIHTAKYSTQYSSACWSSMNEQPEQVQERESGIDAKWAELSRLSAAKLEVLEDDLAREQFRDKLRNWNHNHQSAFGRLQAWVALKKEYLNKVEEIDTVSGAQVQLKLLTAYGKDKQLKSDTLVAALKKLGAELLEARYHTKHSSAQWETPADVTSRESEIDAAWAELSSLADAKQRTLEADLAREIKKEELRVRFAGLAGDFTRWARETSDKVASSQFGFDLPEVEAYAAELQSSDSSIGSEADSYRDRSTAVFDEAAALGVRDNVYTDATPASLAQVRASLDAALAARSQAYQAELDVQRANDALCKRFADVADPLSRWITEQKDVITKSKAELDEQLAYVQQRLASTAADSANLAQVRSLQDEIDSKSITNRHTLLTARDVEVQWQQYEAFLGRKKQMLQEAIEHHKLRGITPEQYAEIETNFKQFDKNSNGRLEPKELKACLYSLGEERGVCLELESNRPFT